MKKNKSVLYDEVLIKHFSKNEEELKEYLEVALEEFQNDGNEKAFLSALALSAKVKGGFSNLAKVSGLNRESLYKALSEHRDPRFSTVMNVLSSLGFSLKIA